MYSGVDTRFLSYICFLSWAVALGLIREMGGPAWEGIVSCTGGSKPIQGLGIKTTWDGGLAVGWAFGGTGDISFFFVETLAWSLEPAARLGTLCLPKPAPLPSI